jgi:hypothetical protein
MPSSNVMEIRGLEKRGGKNYGDNIAEVISGEISPATLSSIKACRLEYFAAALRCPSVRSSAGFPRRRPQSRFVRS